MNVFLTTPRFLTDPEEIVAQEAAERGRKLFVGNIRFDDLQRRFPTVFTFKKHAQQRVASLMTIFASYGAICTIRGSWHRDGLPMNGARAWCMVVYETAETATAALAALKKHEVRVDHCGAIAKQRRSTYQCVHDCPRADFYVRRPHNYTRIYGEDNTDAAGQESEQVLGLPDASVHQAEPPALSSEAARAATAALSSSEWSLPRRTVKSFVLDPLNSFSATLSIRALACVGVTEADTMETENTSAPRAVRRRRRRSCHHGA